MALTAQNDEYGARSSLLCAFCHFHIALFLGNPKFHEHSVVTLCAHRSKLVLNSVSIASCYKYMDALCKRVSVSVKVCLSYLFVISEELTGNRHYLHIALPCSDNVHTSEGRSVKTISYFKESF